MAIQPPSTTPLTFPPTHFAKLAPRSYLHAHLSSPSSRRPSGRLPSESRQQSINTGSLTHCYGSAVVRTGDTAVVCGIRGEILNADDVVDYKPAMTVEALAQRYGGESARLDEGDDENRGNKARKADAEELAELNLLVPNVELSTGCSPNYLPGGPPSDEAQSLSHRILSLLHTSRLLSMDDLRIWHHPPSSTSTKNQPPPAEASPAETTSMSLDAPTSYPNEDITEIEESQRPKVKAYWALHITLLVLSLSGPPFPTLWTALIAAIRNTRLPRARWDADLNSVLCSPSISEARSLRMNGLPMVMSFGVFEAERDGAGLVSASTQTGMEQRRTWVLADVDGFEASCCDEEVTITVRNSNSGRSKKRKAIEVLGIEKGGGGIVGRNEMRELAELAGSRLGEWTELIEGS
ncbi:MAG: hypothetical protein LQ346_008425 [Caloplaca aetnensis]|nr:MAG: hypothetical protein LQ346_008425 [Caloplaca aetnensis]